MSEQTDLIFSQQSYLLRSGQQSVLHPFCQYVSYEFVQLDSSLQCSSASFFSEQANLLSVSSLRLVTKLVPFYNGAFGCIAVPPQVRLMAQEVQAPQVQLLVKGDGFDYLLGGNAGQTAQIGAFYTGKYFIDVLDVSSGEQTSQK